MWCLWSHVSFIVLTMVDSLFSFWLKKWAWWDLFQNHMVSILPPISVQSLLNYLALKHLVWIVEYHICNKSILVLDTLILCCLVIHTWNVVRLHCFLVLWDVGSLLEGTLHIKIWFLRHLPFFSMMSCIWKINSRGMYYKITWE